MPHIVPRLVVLLLFCGGLLVAPSGAQAQELKIGFLAPRTGIITQLGTDMINGFQMYLDEHDGKLGGAKVTFIVEDDKGTVDGDVSMAKKLILQDKVDMIVGAVLGTAAYALAPISNQEKTLFIGTITTADDIAQRQSAKFPYTVFSTWVSSQPTHALGQWACEQGYKRVSAIGTDYAFGYEQVGGFQKAFEDCGGKVVQRILGAFRQQGLRAVHSGHQIRHRRHLRVDGRTDGAAIPQAAARSRQQDDHSGRQHQL